MITEEGLHKIHTAVNAHIPPLVLKNLQGEVEKSAGSDRCTHFRSKKTNQTKKPRKEVGSFFEASAGNNPRMTVAVITSCDLAFCEASVELQLFTLLKTYCTLPVV